MNISIECEQEIDGRWLAEVPELPGVMAYAPTAEAAMARAQALALKALAERLENAEASASQIHILLPRAA